MKKPPVFLVLLLCIIHTSSGNYQTNYSRIIGEKKSESAGGVIAAPFFIGDSAVSDTQFSIKDSRYIVLEGSVSHSNLKEPITRATVTLQNDNLLAFTDHQGKFKISIPESADSITISCSGFQDKQIPVKKLINTSLVPMGKSEKEMFNEQFKNTISLSLLELFRGAIAIRYERFVQTHHSAGIHFSTYFFNHRETRNIKGSESSEGDYQVIDNSEFDGVKIAPFYRYYVWRKLHWGGYIEAKPIIGYFHFPHLDYTSEVAKENATDFWSYGGAIATGLMYTPNKEILMNISLGAQHFSMNAPETYQSQSLDDNWWYKFGPGAYFELKITVGGIF